MTLLCVPISAPTLDAARDAMARAEVEGAELLELRLDLLPPSAAASLIPLARVPVLATCRDAAEGGGKSTADDTARASILRDAIRAGAAIVDFEFAAWQRSAESRELLLDVLAGARACGPAAKQCGLILSAHDFEHRPADLRDLVERIAASEADIVKVAYKAERITDSFDAMDILHEARKPTIALAMGEAGVITRLLAKKLGAFLTFAAPGAGQGTAPGQPTLAEIKHLYRWARVSAETQVYGVIGCPIGHSMSPAIHNAAFDETCVPSPRGEGDGERGIAQPGAAVPHAGFDGLYLPMRVEPASADFDALLDGILIRNEWLHVRGLSITLPHKENALRYVQFVGGQVEELSRRIGAINTIRFDRGVLLSGRNTDYAAAIDSVCAALGCERPDLRGKTVAVIGAGGVARAVVAGFTVAGADVTIYNRTFDRARQLAEEFGCGVRPMALLGSEKVWIIINATSIGMSPHVDASPMQAIEWDSAELVFDTVYNPIRTRLIIQAEEAGLSTVTGDEMFVRQAAAQFEWWTGRPAPLDVMRRVVAERLRI